MVNILLLLLGIALMTCGGEALIRGSLAAAKRFSVSPLLSGLIIVGFGTSMPEFTVSILAALNGQPEIAIGNVVGSNIGNTLLILGVCGLITPLVVKPLVLRRDALTVIAASVLFLMLAGDSVIGSTDGTLFLMAFVGYLVWAYRSERYHAAPAAELHELEAGELTVIPKSSVWMAALVIMGIALLILGSRAVLAGAIGIAEYFEIPDAVIGLTLVAVGTSLPEFTISVIAALRRHADVAVGNILGSNIFNLLGILGVSALLQPLPVPQRMLQFDQWMMLGAAIVLALFLYTGSRLGRIESAILLFSYAVYVGLSFTVFGN